jgi:2-oxoglutarate ferredoxin oxidoreductase subunit alpha
MDLNILIGGEAGQGLQTIGVILAHAFTRMGFHVFADQDYESRIRGGHNFFRIRVKDSRALAASEKLDILLALNKESLLLHYKELGLNGVAIVDSIRDPELSSRYKILYMPMEEISLRVTGNKQAKNSAALGALAGLTRIDISIFIRLIKEHFLKEELIDQNIQTLKEGYNFIIDQKEFVDLAIESLPVKSERMLINGNESIAMGALASGCKFLSAYPMTPTTPIIEYISSHSEEFRTVVIQPEDEIAAIHMAIGASYAGVRSMTVTSGGGFSLMVEGLGLAGMTETPVVIVLGQRPGPAIGLPTRTEQGDLLFCIHASHGEFPRAVLAPSSAEDAFWLTIKAFNLADKYQIPVIILSDHYLATSYFTVDKFDLSSVYIDRGLPLIEDELSNPADYKRHRITGSGISPRALPSYSKALVITDADEHDEEGHLTEDARTRTAMVEKRMKKSSSIRKDIALPLIYGPRTARVTLIGWGSTFGPLYEAINILNKQGMSINLLHFNELWPFPSQAVNRLIADVESLFAVESNATGQFASLFEAQTNKKIKGAILKYDGRPFTAQYIINALQRESL